VPSRKTASNSPFKRLPSPLTGEAHCRTTTGVKFDCHAVLSWVAPGFYTQFQDFTPRCKICFHHHDILTWINEMKKDEASKWLECDNEITMSTFIYSLEDETALRKFAILNAKSIEEFLIDSRSRNALVIAESYLKGDVSEEDLEYAYREAESACEDIEAANDSDDDPTPLEENIDNAALVALWAAYPIGHTGVSPLESAQESALHTAYYCYEINGKAALKEQMQRFLEVGLFQ